MIGGIFWMSVSVSHITWLSQADNLMAAYLEEPLYAFWKNAGAGEDSW